MLMFLIFAIAIIVVLFHFALHSAPWKIPALRLGAVMPRELIVLFAVLTAAWTMAKIERRPFGSYGLPWRSGLWLRLGEGTIWGFGAMTLVLVILRAVHSFSFGLAELDARHLLFYAFGWGVYFLLVGLYEEFTFRGYSQFTLTTAMGFWPAAFLLSAIFGVVHLTNPGENWIGALQVFLTGLLLCVGLERTGNLWFPVGLHAAWDWAETFFYGVPDSGLTFRGHFLNPLFHGSKWLTGGSVGPEGSIVALLVEVAIIGLLMLRFPASRNAEPYVTSS
ncbi:MAG: CPBP family intramembrane metalloprotease [Acidobacteriota bacterium]|nr:CPBP family intramembrane metalloprotease [Acidobacteriota bacterium]